MFILLILNFKSKTLVKVYLVQLVSLTLGFLGYRSLEAISWKGMESTRRYTIVGTSPKMMTDSKGEI